MSLLSVSIGIIAHNEAKNIARLLEALEGQELSTVSIREIIVVSSGSTDATDRTVSQFAQKDPRLKLVVEKERRGKAAAVNIFLSQAREEIVVLMAADLLLQKNTLENLVAPLRDPHVGIVGSHPSPVNDPHTFMGFAAHFVWNIHHQISLREPKMGEMIAFRKIFQKIPRLSAVDEANIEPLIRGQGYRAVYAPKAVVFNKGPETLTEFIARRRHVYCGHLATKHEYSYEVSTLSNFKILFFLLKNFPLSWPALVWTPLVVLLEIYSRFLGFLDYKLNPSRHTIWEMTPSTKELP
jgi:glycosyltransferase involved in cell wall biosynthesis